MPSYVTVQDLANRLDRPVHAAIAQAAIDQVEGAIDDHAGFTVAAGPRQKVFTVNSPATSLAFFLRHATSVQAVRVNGAAVPADGWRLARELHTIVLRQSLQAWDEVTVDYTGGFAPVPPSIRAVALNAAARAYDRPVGGISQRTIGDFSETFDKAEDGGVFLTDDERAAVDAALEAAGA